MGWCSRGGGAGGDKGPLVLGGLGGCGAVSPCGPAPGLAARCGRSAGLDPAAAVTPDFWMDVASLVLLRWGLGGDLLAVVVGSAGVHTCCRVCLRPAACPTAVGQAGARVFAADEGRPAGPPSLVCGACGACVWVWVCGRRAVPRGAAAPCKFPSLFMCVSVGMTTCAAERLSLCMYVSVPCPLPGAAHACHVASCPPPPPPPPCGWCWHRRHPCTPAQVIPAWRVGWRGGLRCARGATPRRRRR